ncbi:MAG: patatin-like phospholipase family protein [Chlamydiae bacterium]|nr:patatin-like phospholipase family protein [Chlamydiota bacterium]
MKKHRFFSSLLSVSLILLMGCEPTLQTYQSCIVQSGSHVVSSIEQKPIRLALVLGAGGAKGMAHVGVLAVLEEAKIPIDLIVGCSAGSLVGALYAKSQSAEEIKKELVKLKRGDLIDFNLFTRCHGLSYGNKLKKFLLDHFGSSQFHELTIPLVVVATELHKGQLVYFNSGAIAPVVHASCALPFVFSPVKIAESVFVDGGVINPIPVDIARKHNAEIVIAVDISSFLPEALPNNLFGVAKRCAEIQFYNLSNDCLKSADVVIRPALEGIGTFDDDSNEIAYEAGKRAATEAIPKILEILKAHQEKSLVKN